MRAISLANLVVDTSMMFRGFFRFNLLYRLLPSQWRQGSETRCLLRCSGVGLSVSLVLWDATVWYTPFSLGERGDIDGDAGLELCKSVLDHKLRVFILPSWTASRFSKVCVTKNTSSTYLSQRSQWVFPRNFSFLDADCWALRRLVLVVWLSPRLFRRNPDGGPMLFYTPGYRLLPL